MTQRWTIGALAAAGGAFALAAGAAAAADLTVVSWGGAYHTDFWADPKEQVVAVLMTQLLPASGSDMHGKFRALVYQSIVK